jgi:hypothetical protein
MSVPPQGNWPPPQQPGNPANSGQPYGPPGNQPGYTASPPGWQQGPWQQPPGPPPQKGNGLKWLLIAVAILLVIGISVGATLIFTRGDGGGGSSPTSGAASDIASANDTGPVSIILDEPTCNAFVGINNSLADLQAKGWGDIRSNLGPIAGWTPDQRAQVEAVAEATRKAAEQVVPLAKQTPHRLVRELYEQFIAYGRAYADSIPSYVPSDDGFASANVNASSAVIGICNTIQYGSASRSIGVQPVDAPPEAAAIGDLGNPARFFDAPHDECSEWTSRLDAFNAATADWQKRDGSIPATDWTPEQRALTDAALPLLTRFADDSEQAALRSPNPVFRDFALATTLYSRAFVSAGSDYVNADGWLNFTAFRFANLIAGACKAVGG